MTIIAVDDEPLALKNLELKLRTCAPEASFLGFRSPHQALEHLRAHPADIAFLDIHMGEMDGLSLAKAVREACPGCAVIFLTAFPEHAVDAFALHASGYLLKPVRPEDLLRELQYATRQSPTPPKAPKKLTVQCFGNFEVFADGKPIPFSRSKSKELLAYLVDRRGAAVSMAEIGSVLWEDGVFNRSRCNQIHSFLHDLAANLDPYTDHSVIIRKRNALSVDVSQLDCDYFRFLDGDTAAMGAYAGECMAQYWWSEFTTGNLTSQV